MDGKWLSILEFAAYKKKSISTVRRYVKANRVKHKEVQGKYYIWVKNYISNHTAEEKEVLELKLEAERLKKEVRELREENTELKMLVQLYESGQMISQTNNDLPPEIPVV